MLLSDFILAGLIRARNVFQYLERRQITKVADSRPVFHGCKGVCHCHDKI